MSGVVPMNPEGDQCPKCGAVLADGLCRQCLLLAGIEPTLPLLRKGETPSTTAESLVAGLFPEMENIRAIGRGGMGVVYQAHQREVDRDIALKLLPREAVDTPEAKERFEIEARAVARLDHPNIITLYEFGERGGSLFLKMKLVENGRSLAHALRERSPWPAKEAVALLIKLARAAHHAHQHGVIHRDIKPGNVLLDPQGEPLLSDFGLARIVEENTSLTRSQIVLGTASYMAPEQAVGKSSGLTTAADVYSLGAVIYEMLAGRPPFEGASTAEILRRVIEDDPAPPDAVNASVDRDLSTICLKCLEKNPARRYGSAETLAEDLVLWQQGRPISARPISAAGRISKWARRRPGIALLASALAASVIIGSTLAIWQAVRATRAEKVAKKEAAKAFRAGESARQEAAISKAVNDFMSDDLFGAASPDREPDRDLKVRTVLDRAAARIGNRFQDQPLIEAAIRLTLAETYESLGEYEKARQHAERSLALRRQALGPEHPNTLKSWHSFAAALYGLGQFALVEGETRAILQIQNRILGPEHPETLIIRMDLANTLNAQRKLADAETELREVLRIQERVLGPDHRNALSTRMNLANTLNGQGKFADAENELRAVLQIQTRVLGPEHPDTLTTKMNLANTLNEQGKLAEGENELRAVLQIQERILGSEHPDALRSRMNLGATLNRERKLTIAEKELRAVFQIQRRVLGPGHPDTLTTKTNLANTVEAERKLPRAGTEIFPVAQTQAGLTALLDSGTELTASLYAEGAFAKAEMEFRALLQIQEGILGPEHSDTLRSLHSLALTLQKRGKLDEAREFATRAMEGRRRALGAMHPETTLSEKLFQELAGTPPPLDATTTAATPELQSLSSADPLFHGDKGEWPRFRGPNGSGVGAASHLPSNLDAIHTVWRIDIDRGLSSPVGWKGRLFFTTEAAPDKRAVICLDSRDGRELWRYESAASGPQFSSSVYSFASSTPFVDDERVYVMDNAEALALDHNGRLLWRNVAAPADVSPQPGAHASAVVADGVMVARAEFGDLQRSAALPGQTNCFVGLDAATGAQKWKLRMENKPSLDSTPLVHGTAGKHEFILTDSATGVMGVDAASGIINWQHDTGSRQRSIHSSVLQNDLLFSGVGVGASLLKLGDARPGEIEVRIIRGFPNVATPLLVADHLYLLGDGGLLTCVRLPSGEELYREQLRATAHPGVGHPNGHYLSSPVAADGKIYCCSQNGEVTVMKLGDTFEVLAVNQLDGPITATPAIAWNHLFVRTDKSLWCFGEKNAMASAEPAPPAPVAKTVVVTSQ